MTSPSIIDLRTRRPVAVGAHKRARPSKSVVYLDTHRQLREEVAFETKMERALAKELKRYVATLNHPTLGMYF